MGKPSHLFEACLSLLLIDNEAEGFGNIGTTFCHLLATACKNRSCPYIRFRFYDKDKENHFVDGVNESCLKTYH